jgi:trans-aconitate 2-methyltransferase
MSSQDWDAVTYDRVSDPQLAWAVEQLDRLELTGDEVVLDAGCGSGRVTALLADRLPRGHVYGVDAAPSMVEHAARTLALRHPARVTTLCKDLVELELPEPLDAVFSNATFHWIPDHERLFARLYDLLRPGGRLVAQCGGMGNIDAFRELAEAVAAERPFADYFRNWRKPWNYADANQTSARLTEAGFEQVSCWLEPKQVLLAEPRPFVETVCLVRHLDPLPAQLRGPFVDAVLERTGVPLTLEYVRLNMTSRKPSA